MVRILWIPPCLSFTLSCNLKQLSVFNNCKLIQNRSESIWVGQINTTKPKRFYVACMNESVKCGIFHHYAVRLAGRLCGHPVSAEAGNHAFTHKYPLHTACCVLSANQRGEKSGMTSSGLLFSWQQWRQCFINTVAVAFICKWASV